MEVEERRRSGSSHKTSKKGGKRVKALTAEEEARRREIVKEKLREKLELEKRALKIVERLLEDSVAEDFLVDCAKFIVSANYKDAVEERSIAKMCGYPICSNKLGKIPTQQFRICTKTNKVYDITERKCYCSNFCYKASKEFELQISKTPLWLRQHESPPEIKLMKKGDGGSSGEEVLLSERRLQEDDIENPLAAHPDDPHSSQQGPAGGGHSESSDIEQEQDFVSTVVSQQQGPRVHWGDLPKRTDEDKKDKPNGEQVTEERGLPDAPSVDEAAAQLNLCTLSEAVAQTAPLPVDSTTTQAESTNLLTSPPCEDSNSPTESKHLLSSTLINTNQDDHDMALTNQPGLNITQVGMSKRGAAGLRDLLKKNTAEAKPASIRLNLLECLRRTLKDWSTDETLKFLYGADHSLGSPYADVIEDKEVEVKEEELDEDDLEDEVTEEDAEGVDAEVQKRPAAAPDYRTLRTETQQLELRVKEFYKGTWIVPEEVEEPHGDKVTVQDQSTKDPALPLVDSHAQHLIQKRITVEKLTSCLKNIVGPLRLAMSDISTDLNNLVRTFRFTNTNIIHKTPEWTLIAVVLLHLLAEVSPVVREALETRASVEYLNTLMEELGLQEQDLLNLVQLFKTPTH
ncbi:putative RNA polymerase II subunit B1 CTD phosphatase rpap2 isoform X2 [Epinephelus lanceolatus]|uniref:putative RNA polymerase II subunit B1 CTD phosphatase rpap2 isoform X2 n=1 Tax=Epinephelus lanceolatus TaxID=310571 RepID=UPI0014487F37|nr:putative RNA polymerase II subunit B1 CTD phosphatase rpap2 isoform X2 [Epinephelus lanceolatus]